MDSKTNTNNCEHKHMRPRASWRFCGACNTHQPLDPTVCRSCFGKGIKHRTVSIYQRQRGQQGKAYRCGDCKGTGAIAPIPCVKCDNPSVFTVSDVMKTDGTWKYFGQDIMPRALCQCCYDLEAAE